MDNLNQQQNLELIAQPNDNSVNSILVSSPSFNNPTVNIQQNIQPNSINRLTINSNLLQSGSGKASKGLSVTSNGDINLYGINKALSSCDGFLVIPVSQLGKQHYTVSYWHWNTDTFNQIGVTATEDNTIITFTFPTGRGINVNYQGEFYNGNRKLTTTINQYETIQLKDSADLSGTQVTSTASIAVYSGNDYYGVDTDFFGKRSHLVAQIPHVLTLSRIYYVTPLTGKSSTIIKIVSIEASTSVIVYSSKTGAAVHNAFIDTAGGHTEVKISDLNAFVTIDASNPVLVAQFGPTGSTSAQYGSDPSMLMVPPSDKFLAAYTFSIADATGYLSVIIDSTKTAGIRLDGTVVDLTGWTNFQSIDGITMAGKVMQVSTGVHQLTHATPGVKLGAQIYVTSADDCSYAYPAGMCVPIDTTIASTTTTISTTPATKAPLSQNGEYHILLT